MLKQHIAACMLATALVAAPAMAQTGSQSPAPSAPLTNETAPGAAPGMDSPAMPTPGGQANPSAPTSGAQAPGGAAGGAGMTADAMAPGHDLQVEGGFIVGQTAGHHFSTDIVGEEVYSADDDNIGSVTDLIIDGEDRVVGVLIGVGGFLGVGERDVAVPISDLEIVYDVDATASTGTSDAQSREISEIRVAMTREQLENAPEFGRLDAPAATPAPAPTAPAPGGAAPN